MDMYIHTVFQDKEAVMSRYIDADALKIPSEEMIAKMIVDSAPSIDIVFCKECRHWSQAPKTERGWCDKCDGLLEPNFYCADGKRRSE